MSLKYPNADLVYLPQLIFENKLIGSFVWKQTILPGLAAFGFLVISKFTRWFLKERQVDQFDIRDSHDHTKNVFSEQY